MSRWEKKLRGRKGKRKGGKKRLDQGTNSLFNLRTRTSIEAENGKKTGEDYHAEKHKSLGGSTGLAGQKK